MMRRFVILGVLANVTLAATAMQTTLIPTGWHISPPASGVATTGTMPQGIALSPDGTKLAVIEAGVNPPALRILSVPSLQAVRVIELKDAFGSPAWLNGTTVLVPGASTNTVLSADIGSGTVRALETPSNFVTAVAVSSDTLATVSDTRNELDTFRLTSQARTSPSRTVPTGQHPAAVVVTRGVAYVADKGGATVTAAPLRLNATIEKPLTIPVDLHPAALALSKDGSKLYVACADADIIDVIDTATDQVAQRISVGLPQGSGASPNGLALASDGTLFVSLGAENAVAAIRGGKVIARVPVGWYPTGVAVDARNVYVVDGKGEGSHANPEFNPALRHGPGYVAAILTGSVRTIPRSAFNAASTDAVLANIPSPQPTPPQTVVRPDGPIKHVIYIIKENRTYDQVLGDIPNADGDPKLVWFGENVTPNQHAIARRFGVFDNTYADAQVSANGHNWSTAAFANDYLERFWPPNYGGRREVYDFEDGAVASTPQNGYLWDDANKHGVAFRDYGEFVSYAVIGGGFVTTSMPGLQGKIDERYPPFDLQANDEARIDEWKKEFDGYVKRDDLPPLEIVRLPNDHTSGTKPGTLTPQAYVAQNDHAFGRLVDAVSHSKYWSSTAIFAIEDDAQNGPDHVDDQRTTFYLASPYAAAGTHHAHYSTSGVVRTIELLLGLSPMSIYDAVAPPLYDAFTLQPSLAAFDAVAPRVDVTEKNKQTAYGAEQSARMDFTRADDVDDAKLNDILRHAVGKP
jgi:YVTN family beta-propeller protein